MRVIKHLVIKMDVVVVLLFIYFFSYDSIKRGKERSLNVSLFYFDVFV